MDERRVREPAGGGDSPTFWAAYSLGTRVVASVVATAALGFAYWLLNPVSPLLKEAKEADAVLRKLDFYDETRSCLPGLCIRSPARFTSAAQVEALEKSPFHTDATRRAAVDDLKAYAARVSEYVDTCTAARKAGTWTKEAQQAAERVLEAKREAASLAWRAACPPPC